MTSLGVVLASPYAQLPELARSAERAGAASVWVVEATRDALVQAAVVAEATYRVRVGTAIALAFPRSPTTTAMAAWDLDELSGQRFTLGLGSQVRRVLEDRFSVPWQPPAPRMREYVQAVRSVWAASRGDAEGFEGRFYRVRMPGFHTAGDSERRVPPVYVAAVGPRMIETAARHADGVLGHPLTSVSHLRERFVPAAEGALAGAGRPREEVAICSGLIVSAGEDGDAAVEDAKRQVGFYGTTPNYRAIFDADGYEGLTDRLRAAWRDGGPAALVAAVPDEVVERYAVAGTPAQVRARLSEYEGLVDHLLLGGPNVAVSPERMAARTEGIIAALS